MSKVVCDERRCTWHGDEADLLKAPNPFEAGCTITACPECKAIEASVMACEMIGCWKASSCGLNTPDGYKRLCGVHAKPFWPSVTTA